MGKMKIGSADSKKIYTQPVKIKHVEVPVEKIVEVPVEVPVEVEKIIEVEKVVIKNPEFSEINHLKKIYQNNKESVNELKQYINVKFNEVDDFNEGTNSDINILKLKYQKLYDDTLNNHNKMIEKMQLYNQSLKDIEKKIK